MKLLPFDLDSFREIVDANVLRIDGWTETEQGTYIAIGEKVFFKAKEKLI